MLKHCLDTPSDMHAVADHRCEHCNGSVAVSTEGVTFCHECRNLGAVILPHTTDDALTPEAEDYAQEHGETRNELAQALRGFAVCIQRIDHARQRISRTQEQIADARRHIAQAQDVRDDLLAFLSADAREMLEERGGAYIGGELWVLAGSTDAGVPILRRIQPMVVGE